MTASMFPSLVSPFFDRRPRRRCQVVCPVCRRVKREYVGRAQLVVMGSPCVECRIDYAGAVAAARYVEAKKAAKAAERTRDR